ncbi:reverse transcriptase [Phytophthora megakarya]|uniref:Reverse transcriptase n=1 Tax=Phytophthora megakarya TaxID=4795 RepID=A0A225VRF8_9STRA|nr:reverse transcriptase [Phytophthora megakarya]
MAEYSGMNHGVIAALEHGAEDLVIVGESSLVFQQSLGVIACRKDSLMTATQSSDNALYYTGASIRMVDENLPEMSLRLVVPTTMRQEVLQNCHDSIEGGHQGVVHSYQRVKHNYYWIGLYADVERHVKSCLACSSSKSFPQLKGYSPGNVRTERPFQLVSVDFGILLPSSRGGTPLCCYGTVRLPGS